MTATSTKTPPVHACLGHRSDIDQRALSGESQARRLELKREIEPGHIVAPEAASAPGRRPRGVAVEADLALPQLL